MHAGVSGVFWSGFEPGMSSSPARANPRSWSLREHLQRATPTIHMPYISGVSGVVCINAHARVCVYIITVYVHVVIVRAWLCVCRWKYVYSYMHPPLPGYQPCVYACACRLLSQGCMPSTIGAKLLVLYSFIVRLLYMRIHRHSPRATSASTSLSYAYIPNLST